MLDNDFKKDLTQRRKNLYHLLGKNVCIVTSGFEKARNNDVHYVFRQESNFTYLTGFPEQDSVALFNPSDDKEPYILFVREKDMLAELWTGFRYGVDGAKEIFEPDTVYLLKDLEKILRKKLRKKHIFYDKNHGHTANKTILQSIKSFARIAKPVLAGDLIEELRIIKSPWEIEQMQIANNISIEAHHALMSMSCKNEYEMQAEFEYICAKKGVKSFAYPAITASGMSAVCLHYNFNNATIGKNDLILVDAGCEWNSYASDITRTYPASGQFTAVQKDVYTVVLEAQKSVIKRMGEGNVTMKETNDLAIEKLVDGLKDLNILKESKEEILENKLFSAYYPHGIGHFMGMDVHDVGTKLMRKNDRKFEPGMTVTVEPGLYFQEYHDEVPAEFIGMGIRIEDNIVFTKDGILNLTAKAVKEIKDIEKMAGKKG